ncbi:MAG: hypothetical protein BGO05_08575 [Rhizobiales bacterium 63-7]|nr:MAG: hypothetical protein BGO05_08575 [Rhizobiales bacterium 63-7]
MTRFFAAILGFCALCLVAAGARAEEYIAAFDQQIVLSRDGTMTVTETIDANGEGRDIKRGIFRDFPLTMVDAKGRKQTVDFDLRSVERDGNKEDDHTESISGGIRIYIGNKDVILPPGMHRYRLTYTTGRQIRYFADHDELYWNVTGNGWLFPINAVSASLTLPEGAKVLDTIYFTGPLGATGKDATAKASGNHVDVSTTRPLGAGEGLTFAVSLPKGVIDPPSAAQNAAWALRDSMAYVFGLGGFAAVFLYYLWSWVKVGRDPSAGVMVPRWDAPDGISPALVNYIDNKGFSGGGWTAFSATAINLAVRGYVVLEDLTGSVSIRRTEKPVTEKLETGEKRLLDTVPSPGATLKIDKANGARIKTVGETFRAAIEKEHRGEYYRANIGYIVLGAALSLAAIAGVVFLGGLSDTAMAMLVGGVVVAVVIGWISLSLISGTRKMNSLVARIFLIIVAAVLMFFGAGILLAIAAGAYVELGDPHEYLPVYGVGGIALLNILYFFIMGAPTPLGRRMMDGIDGLRQYLTLAEKDRMNMAGAPAMSPQHFETLLPYAVALGVEKPWSEAFETWLKTAAAGAVAYSPVWYAGSHGNIGERIGGFSSSMASTIRSTLPAPQSSSSSGFSGGSSGGGGGGGGGGGW